MKTKFISERRSAIPALADESGLPERFYSIELKGGNQNTMEEPQLTFKLGPFRAAIFLNDVAGRQKASVSLEKSFTKDGETWEHQKMRLLDPKEIDKLIVVLQDVKTTIYKEFE